MQEHAHLQSLRDRRRLQVLARFMGKVPTGAIQECSRPATKCHHAGLREATMAERGIGEEDRGHAPALSDSALKLEQSDEVGFSRFAVRTMADLQISLSMPASKDRKTVGRRSSAASVCQAFVHLRSFYCRLPTAQLPYQEHSEMKESFIKLQKLKQAEKGVLASAASQLQSMWQQAKLEHLERLECAFR